MDFDTKFGTIWLPELEGLLYGKDRDGLIAGPQFFDKYDATVAYEEYVSRWNEASVNIVFIEGNNAYEFFCYQDPKKSHSKTSLCIYKDSLGKNGIFLKEKEHIKESGCKLGIYYKTPTGFKRMGIPFSANVKIISEKDIISGSYEDIIRKLSEKSS